MIVSSNIYWMKSNYINRFVLLTLINAATNSVSFFVLCYAACQHSESNSLLVLNSLMMDMRVYRKDLALIRGRPLIANSGHGGGVGSNTMAFSSGVPSVVIEADEVSNGSGNNSGSGTGPNGEIQASPLPSPSPIPTPAPHETTAMLRPPTARPRASDGVAAPTSPAAPATATAAVPPSPQVSGYTTTTGEAATVPAGITSPPGLFRRASRLEAGRRGSVIFGSMMSAGQGPSPADYNSLGNNDTLGALPPPTPMNRLAGSPTVASNAGDGRTGAAGNRSSFGAPNNQQGNNSGGGHYFVVPREKITEALTTVAHELLNWTKQGTSQ
jgi:hypothetical protein